MLRQLIHIGVLLLFMSAAVGQSVPGAKGDSNVNPIVKSGVTKTKPSTSVNIFSSERKQLTPEESLADTIIWEKFRFIPQKGTISEYSYFFETVNGATQKVYFNKEEDLNTLVWDSVNNIYYNRLNSINSLDPQYVVMGWHPYWMKDSYLGYNYGLLSIISYYAYDVDAATGAYIDSATINDWRTTPMIDTAHSRGVKVMLTVTSYGKEQNQQLLSNKKAWANLADSLKSLLEDRDGYGIDLDFADIPPGRSEDFTMFVTSLKQRLGPEYILTLQIPPYDGHISMDFTALDTVVKYFILQAFDYGYLDCNGNAAPIAALNSISGDCPSIYKTFQACLSSGLDPAKAILALPAYGTKWSMKGQGWPRNQAFEGYLTYDDVMSEYASFYEPIYEVVSGSSYFLLNKGGKSSELVWFESGESVDVKSKWALSHGFKGVGIWALGYDGSHPGIWNTVAVNFGVNPLQEIKPIGYENGQLYSIMAAFVKHRRAIGFGVLFMFGFFILGLFISLFDWRVREVFFQNYTYRALFSGIILALLLAAVVMIRGITLSLGSLLIGLVTGAIVVFLITSSYKYYRSKLP